MGVSGEDKRGMGRTYSGVCPDVTSTCCQGINNRPEEVCALFAGRNRPFVLATLVTERLMLVGQARKPRDRQSGVGKVATKGKLRGVTDHLVPMSVER